MAKCMMVASGDAIYGHVLIDLMQVSFLKSKNIVNIDD